MTTLTRIWSELKFLLHPKWRRRRREINRRILMQAAIVLCREIELSRINREIKALEDSKHGNAT